MKVKRKTTTNHPLYRRRFGDFVHAGHYRLDCDNVEPVLVPLVVGNAGHCRQFA